MSSTETRLAAERKQLRKFGLVVGAVFALLFGLLPLLKGRHSPPLWPWGLMAALSLAALLAPPLLRRPYRGWIKLGHALGWINSKIILGAFFFLIITPLAVAMRAFGRDALRLKLEPSLPSYRIRRDDWNGGEGMQRPY